MMRAIPILAAMLVLAGCGEKEQTASSGYKPDEKAWQTAATPYGARNYKGGDRAAWETQMRERIQAQNEYGRVN
jgi:hypothetical protein